MAGGTEIHGAGNDNSPVLAQALSGPHRDALDAGGDASSPASLLCEPFSFLAVYRPTSRAVRIYPIGVQPPFDAPMDLTEAQAHGLMAELRRALDAPALAEDLQRDTRR